MRRLRLSLVLAALAAMPSFVAAQTPPVVETLSVSADKAYTWRDGDFTIVQLEGPVAFELDDVKMSADAAVIWFKQVPGEVFDRQQIEVALLGNALLQQGEVRRSGNRLYVTSLVRGNVRLSANQRLSRPRTDSPDYQIAQAMREESGLTATPEGDHWRLPTPTPAVDTSLLPRPVAAELPPTVQARFQNLETYQTDDGYIAAALAGGATVVVRHPPEQLIQMSAARIVVLTKLRKLTDLQGDAGSLNLGDAVEGVYLEGDVQIDYTGKSARSPESRLQANRAYYEIATDRAVLTDAVLHTNDARAHIPIIVRAQTLKQLSLEKDRAEYKMEHAKLTTSSFATPTFAIAASKAYLKQIDSGEDYYGRYNTFSAVNTTAQFWGVPVLWAPYSAGTVTEHGFPLRSVDIGSSNRFGFFTRTEWGLFETIGRVPPKDLDVSYRADYLGTRGPAGGIDADYKGGFITSDSQQPWNFDGKLNSYFVDDHGTDKFGADRRDVEPEETQRGVISWQHQHFLPEDWQVQLRAAWVSDPTFLEEYFPSLYRRDEPQDIAVYLKHQRDTEAFTFLAQTQPNDFVTTSELAQEQFEIQRMPEVGYHRIGDSLGQDTLTYFGDSSAARLKFQKSDATLAQQGYPLTLSPGIPAEGRFGVTDEAVDRGDTRHEIDYPLQVDKFRVVPYIVGRSTYYSDTVDQGSENRIFAGTGLRITTAFWKVDDDISSDLFDVHRIRHVVEPEINFFASGQSVDQNDLFIYDQQTDAINDVQAAQIALHNRWQTKRGGPGNWRSVDLVTWNLEGNFFANKPDAVALEPQSFRGLFFPSMPETSVPRNSVNTDVNWRISDSTAFLSDAEYNLDENHLATAAAGLAVQRGDRMTWYVGDRYINADASDTVGTPSFNHPSITAPADNSIDSNIVSALMSYEVSTRYSIGLGHSYDTGSSHNSASTVSVTRHFDSFYVIVSARRDEETGDSGFFVGIRPNYMRSSSSNLALGQ